MSKKHHPIEYRNYDLYTSPILVLTGEKWILSDIPSNTFHFHNCLEIGICEKYSGTMRFSNSSFSISEGDITVIGTNICHTTFSSPGTNSKWSYIFIDFDQLLTSIFPIKSYIDTTVYDNLVRDSCVKLPKEKHPIIYNLVTTIIELSQKKTPNYHLESCGLALSLFVELLNIGSITNTATVNLNSSNTFALAPALTYIQNNYMNSFSIDYLAQLCNMSPTHFRRVFSQIMQTNPQTHLTNLRIAKATVLLRSTEKPILEISEEVGFKSVSSFNRHFIKIIGTAPLKWRQKNNFVNHRDVINYSGWMLPPDQTK